MYLQARIFIKTALVQLLLALLLGALFWLNAARPLSPWLSLSLPLYYHLLMVGWVTQLIFGVALWLFPPLSREQPHGDERIAWFGYATLNLGLLLRALAEPSHALAAATWSAWGLVLAGLLQMLAIWALVIAIWPRIKGRATRKEPTHAND